MNRLLLMTFILLNFSLLLVAQSDPIVIKGKVVDLETKEEIVFVSIGIEGTSIGAASNTDGRFELRIPVELKNKTLFFSAIGYKNASFQISELLIQPEILIELTPQSYDIDAVNVAADSRVLQRILRTASQNIPQNYISGPVNMKLYYEERGESAEHATRKTTKTIVDLYDAKGYVYPSWADAFNSRSYRITEAQKPFSDYSFRAAANQLDELLELDIARLSNTILNPNLLSGFDLRMEANTRFEGDSVWIISYEAKKLDLAHTGSFYPTSYKGKIYIAHTSYAVLRNELHLSDAKANPQGRSLAVNSNANTNSQINITTRYKKVQGKYVLASIDLEKQYTSAEQQVVYESGKLILLELETTSTNAVSGRNYFAQPKPNETFWQNFTLPSN